MRDSVETRAHGAVTVITLSRADVRNAVDADRAPKLYEAFPAFDADPQARVAVCHGHAVSFVPTGISKLVHGWRSNLSPQR